MEDHGVPEPRGGADVAPSDPDQSDVSQDPSTPVIGDLDQAPEAEPALTIVNDIRTGDRGGL